MLVLKHGDCFHTVDCPHCKAQIGFVDDDIQVSIGSDVHFGALQKWHKEYIFCPECKKMIKFRYNLNGEELPDHELCQYQ